MTPANKPHLKLHLSGQRVRLLREGALGWSAQEARQFITQHYGCLQGFANFTGLNYGATCQASRSDNPNMLNTAGRVREIRAILGLHLVEPKALKVLLVGIQAQRHAERRAAKGPDWVFGHN